MRISEILGLAIHNLFSRRHTTASIVLCFVFMAVLFLSTSIYSDSLESELDGIVTKQISLSSYSGIVDDPQARDGVLRTVRSAGENSVTAHILSDVAELAHVSNSTIGADIGSTDSDEYDDNIENYSIVIGGREYRGNDNQSYTFPYENHKGAWSGVQGEDLSVPLSIDIACGGQLPILSRNEEREFRNKFPGRNILVAGKTITDRSGILISDYLLERFGIPSSDCGKIVGEKISILANEGALAKKAVLRDVVIAGVVSEDFFRVETRRDSGHIIVTAENENVNGIAQEAPMLIRIDVDSYGDVTREMERAKASVGSHASELYCSENVLQVYSELSYQYDIMRYILMILVIMLSLALIVNIINIVLFHINRKGYYYGIVKSLGMRKRDISLLVYFDFLMCIMLAILLAAPITSIMVIALDGYLAPAIGFSLSGGIQQLAVPTIKMVPAALVVAFLLSQIVLGKIKRIGAIKLLSMNRVSD